MGDIFAFGVNSYLLISQLIVETEIPSKLEIYLIVIKVLFIELVMVAKFVFVALISY